MVRVKFRYIVIQIIPEDERIIGTLPITDQSLYQCIMKNVDKYYGDLGVATVRSGIRCKYCNEQTRIAIIRLKHRSHRFVSSILPMATVLGGHRIKFRTLYNGATIMQCNKFIVKYQQQYLDEKCGEIASASEKKRLIENVLNVKMVA